jgi:hypothetical protein
MQNTHMLQKLYRESKLRYQKKHLDFDLNKLHNLINDLYQQSQENYSKLSSPKTCDDVVYSNIWIWQEISKDIATKEIIEPFELSDPPTKLKASSDFLKNYPPELVEEYKTNPSKINISDLTQKFIAVVKERNQFSLDKGYSSRLGMYLKKYQIPLSEYTKFQTFDSSKINSLDFSQHCLICQIKPFPIKNINDLSILFENLPLDLKDKIRATKISLAEISETRYIKETDSFEITLDRKLNSNHQTIDLIHEFSHIISHLKNFQQGKNPFKAGFYSSEKSAINIELKFLKRHFPKLFAAKMGIISHCIKQTIFETELYQHTDRNQPLDAKYLLNPEILYQSFYLLPYAIAYTNILSKTSKNLITTN